MFAEEVRVDSVALGVCTRPGQGRGHRFLHDLAEMPSHRELLPAAHPRGLDEDDVAANRCPHQPHCYAWLLHPFFDLLLRAELRHAEELPHDFRCHRHLVVVALRDTPSLFARYRCDLTLQVAYAGFASEAVNDFLQAFIAEFVRDMQFLFARVARQFDDLHAVAQRFWNWIHPVRRGNEQNLRQIERHV